MIQHLILTESIRRVPFIGESRLWIMLVLVCLLCIPARAADPQAVTVTGQSREKQIEAVHELLDEADRLEYDEPARAREIYQDALTLSRNIHFVWGEAAATLQVASCTARLGNNTEAIPLFLKALKLSTTIDDDILSSDIYISLGTSYFDMGDFEKALENFQQSLRLREPTGDSDRIAKCQTNIGNVHWMLQDYQKALAYYEQALAVFRANDFPLGVAGLTLNVGKVYLKLDQLDEALDALQKARRIFTDLENEYGRSMALTGIADVLALKGEHAQALEMHREALGIREQIGDAKGIVTSHTAIGTVLVKLRQFRKARRHLEQALRMAEERNLRNELKLIHFGLHELYVALGNYPKALNHFKQYTELTEELQSGEKERRIRELQARHTVEQELEQLEYETAMAELAVDGERKVRNLSIGLAILIALFALVVWTLYRQKVNANRELDRINRLDTLTGLANRRELVRRLDEEMKRSARSGQPFAVLLIDVDHFKEINDRFGHEAGDQVLQQIADRLFEAVRETDVAGRWGGEEFLVLLPFTDLQGAGRIGEKLRTAIADEPFRHDHRGIALTITVGAAQYHEEEDTGGADLLRRADAALYSGKSGGRNRVTTEP